MRLFKSNIEAALDSDPAAEVGVVPVAVPAKLSFKARLLRWLKNETIQGALVLLLMLLVFFSTPILHLPDSYYSAVDIIQPYTLTGVKAPPGFEVKNSILSDTVFSYNSFYMFNRESLWSGQLPLWNPYNSGGVPHLANLQSAVFSIFTLPNYFLPFKLGLLATAFMKLFGLGFFTFLFLKQLKLHQLAALVGAAGFMFGGFQVVWLQYTVTGVVITLPAGLYFAERILGRLEPGQGQPGGGRRYSGSLVGLCLAVLAGVLAGHPETFFYTLLVLSAYIVFRFLVLAHRHGYRRAALLELLKAAIQMIGAGVLAAGLAAIQLLPFYEYLQNSLAITDRLGGSIGHYTIAPDYGALLFFPDALGNPTTSFGPTYLNYNEINGQYTGSLILLLALFSLVYFFRSLYVRFFTLLAVVWLLYSYDLLGAHDLITALPGMQFGYVGRSFPVWLFSLSCCAALFVDYQLKSPGLAALKWSRLRPLLFGAVGVVFLALGILATRQLVQNQFSLLQPYQKGFLRYVPGHIWFIGLTFGAGLVAVLGLGLLRRRSVQLACGGVLLVLVFLQSGWLLKEYNPTVSNNYFYPPTEALGRLREKVGSATVMMTGWNSIPVNMNMIYKFSEIPNYDSLWINYYERLAREQFGPGETTQFNANILRSSEKAFKLFGVQYFMPVREPFSLDLGMTDLQFVATVRTSAGEILSGQSLSQTFRALSPDLRQILVSPYTYDRANRCTLNFRLEEAQSGRLVAQQSFNCADLKDDTPVNFSFPPQPDSRDRDYRLTVTSPDGQPGQAASLVYKPQLRYPAGQLRVGGRVVPGGLDFDFFAGVTANFANQGKADYRRVYQYKASLGRYYTVSRAEVAPTDQAARQAIDRPDFDPYQRVILSLLAGSSVVPASDEPPAAAQVVSEEAQTVRLKVTRRQPGYLVLTKPFYPGWKVAVNGVEQPLVRADYAFNAVKLDAGVSDIKFYYDPLSFKLGTGVSLLSLVAGLVLLNWGRWRKLFGKGRKGRVI